MQKLRNGRPNRFCNMLFRKFCSQVDRTDTKTEANHNKFFFKLEKVALSDAWPLEATRPASRSRL